MSEAKEPVPQVTEEAGTGEQTSVKNLTRRLDHMVPDPVLVPRDPVLPTPQP